MSIRPIVRNGSNLLVSWPGAKNFPWNNFATNPLPSESDDPRVEEGLRRFRKFVIEFRSDGSKGLARSRAKIDSQRMTKGTGQAVLGCNVGGRHVDSRPGGVLPTYRHPQQPRPIRLAEAASLIGLVRRQGTSSERR